MADLILVSIFIAFIALCVAYVGWCDRIIGSDELQPLESTPVPTDADASPAAVEVMA